MKKHQPYTYVLVFLILTAEVLSAAAEPNAMDTVHQQIEQVWRIRQDTTGLDAFGRQTMAQAMKILPLKSQAVKPLISYLTLENDWMIRYWIIDLLGYFKSDEIVDILSAVIRDASEELDVRLKAVESMQKQEYHSADNALRSLSKLKLDKKIAKSIRKSLKIFKD
ncbi:MAG: HEAT repeat domain-containing protein [bacterium]